MKNKENKKLDEIYSFVDKSKNKKTIKDNNLFELFPSEEKPITKESLIKNDIKNKENIVIPKEKNIITSSIDDDLKEDIQIISDKGKSDLMRAFDSLSNPVNMECNTILTNNQVVALSTINYLAQVYDIPFYKHFVKSFPRYRISGDDGRGRKELIEIANAIRRDKEEEHNRFMEMLGRR